MMFPRFIFCCLALWSSYAQGHKQFWDGLLAKRFTSLTELSVSEDAEKLTSYFKARGVSNEKEMKALFQEDLLHIAEALSLLFERETDVVLNNFLGEHLCLLEGLQPQIDHVGRELFGPICIYLPLIEKMADQLNLICLKNHIFPSTQVVKVLQESDPNVRGVTIGRLYFQDRINEKVKCIELFQASLRDGTYPQEIEATKERLSLLHASEGTGGAAPIDHISIELSTLEEVSLIHQRIQELSSETLKPYQMELSHNANDGSTQTKTLLRDLSLAPFNKVIEFVSYTSKIRI